MMKRNGFIGHALLLFCSIGDVAGLYRYGGLPLLPTNVDLDGAALSRHDAGYVTLRHPGSTSPLSGPDELVFELRVLTNGTLSVNAYLELSQPVGASVFGTYTTSPLQVFTTFNDTAQSLNGNLQRELRRERRQSPRSMAETSLLTRAYSPRIAVSSSELVLRGIPVGTLVHIRMADVSDGPPFHGSFDVLYAVHPWPRIMYVSAAQERGNAATLDSRILEGFAARRVSEMAMRRPLVLATDPSPSFEFPVARPGEYAPGGFRILPSCRGLLRQVNKIFRPAALVALSVLLVVVWISWAIADAVRLLHDLCCALERPKEAKLEKERSRIFCGDSRDVIHVQPMGLGISQGQLKVIVEALEGGENVG